MSQSWLIASGKGGVGKSMLTAALGYALAKRQMKTCCVDADLGLRDLDMLMNLHSQVVYDLVDVANRDCMLKSALIGSNDYLSLLPASQSAGHTDLDGEAFAKILCKLKKRFGYILTDAPAGIEHGLTNLIAPSDYCLVVTTPDDVAIRNAERVISVMEQHHKQRPLLVVNRVREELLKKGLTYTPQVVANQLDVPLLGYIPEDSQIVASLNTHENFMDKKCPAAEAVERICQRFLGQYVEMPAPGKLRHWHKKSAGKGGISL
ncbi:MAG: septum site-determining protein MinD [Clostridiales bacterium]|nr:septum site-determining protein MinD [Clostridiales bacterium]